MGPVDDSVTTATESQSHNMIGIVLILSILFFCLGKTALRPHAPLWKISVDCCTVQLEGIRLFSACASSSGSRVISFFASQTLHNIKKFKKKSGDVNDEAKFSLLFFASRES